MPQVINTNYVSLNSQKSLNRSQNDLAVAMQRLSSGLRINNAMDDAAGLAIGVKMDSQVRGMTVALRNASDGISYSQIADTALATSADQLQRMRELAIQSLNGTVSDTDRSKINARYSLLQEEALRIQNSAKMNGIAVLGGTAQAFQVGANATDSIEATYTSVDISGTSVLLTGDASTALDQIDTWLGNISDMRATIGATQSRLNFTMQYLEGARENQAAARSRIMDADFASETAALSRAQILQQGGIAMVSQANQLPQNVLSLLR